LDEWAAGSGIRFAVFGNRQAVGGAPVCRYLGAEAAKKRGATLRRA